MPSYNVKPFRFIKELNTVYFKFNLIYNLRRIQLNLQLPKTIAYKKRDLIFKVLFEIIQEHSIKQALCVKELIRKYKIKMLQKQGLCTSSSTIKFRFNQQNSSFESELNLTNKSNKAIYFKVISSFGYILSHNIESKRKIQAQESLLIKLKFKIPNQIKKHSELLIVSFSHSQTSRHLKTSFDEVINFNLEFDQNIPEEHDFINQFLNQECEAICKEAQQAYNNSDVKNSLKKFQQAFLLYRQYIPSLYGMSMCYYKLAQYTQALLSNQTALLYQDNQSFRWLRIQIIFQIYKKLPKQMLLINYLKQLLNQVDSSVITSANKLQLLQILNQDSQFINKQKGGRQMYEFIEKALNNYQTDQSIKVLYKNKRLFQKDINQLLQIKSTTSVQQPPEYVLDPITYQIIRDPVISPYGHSYERNTLLQYLAKHQNKDLFTRQQMRYQWAKTNNALKQFIAQNQNLKHWQQYEAEISTFK